MQRATQPRGSTWTFILRRQAAQYRGGSNARRSRHGRCCPLPGVRRSSRRRARSRSQGLRQLLDRHLELVEQVEIVPRVAAEGCEVVADDDCVDAAEQPVTGTEV